MEERAENLAGQLPDRREYPRQAVDEEAVLLLVNQGSRVPCRVIELSIEGCRLRTGERFLAGILVRIEVTFTINGIAFRFSGLTEWTDDQNVVGIRFVGITSRRRDELTDIIGEVEADNKARAERVAAEKLAAGSKPPEEAVKEQAQVQAVRQAATHLVVAQPRPELQPKTLSQAMSPPLPRSSPQPRLSPHLVSSPRPVTSSPPAAKPSKRERRAQSRHEVDTSAVLYLINVGSALHGRIVDLSSDGCRVRTTERFPVGIYTRVETEFRLDGLPFRLGGVIQAIHDRDRRLVGIRFLDMSVRKREQVEQLIEEIQEMEANRQAIKPPDPGQESREGQGLTTPPQTLIISTGFGAR